MRVTTSHRSGTLGPAPLAEAVPTASTTIARVARLRLFAQAREAAGTGETVVEGDTVGAVLDAAVSRFGSSFTEILPTCRIWVNGEPAARHDAVADSDEVAVFGYRVGYADESPSLPRQVHNVLAGLIVPVTLPAPPEDTALLAAYD